MYYSASVHHFARDAGFFYHCLLRGRVPAYEYRLMTPQFPRNTLRTRRKHLGNEMHRVKLLIIPPIVRNGYSGTLLPKYIERGGFSVLRSCSAHSCQSAGRVRGVPVPLHANRPVSIDSGGPAIILGRDTKTRRRRDGGGGGGGGGDVGRVRASARLFTSMPFLSWRVPSVTRK